MTGVTKMAVLADERTTRMAAVLRAATKAGLSEEDAGKLVAAYAEEEPQQERPVICGNVDKASKLRCARPPHPDEPGDRQDHGAEDGDGKLVSWQGQPTLAEQIDSERGIGKRCRAKGLATRYGVEHPDYRQDDLALICIRAAHGEEKMHADDSRGELITW